LITSGALGPVFFPLRSKAAARTAFDRLLERGVIGDWREPDVIRIAPHPLYNSFTDVWTFVDVLAGILEHHGS
jgi:kynureninase